MIIENQKATDERFSNVDENELEIKIRILSESAPFPLLPFFLQNRDLVNKYLRKNTYSLEIKEDIDSVPASWWYKNQEGILRAKIKDRVYTDLEKLEWIKCAIDVVYFTKKYVKITTLDEGIQPFLLRDYQVDTLDAFQKNRFTILMQCRQSGKCCSSKTLINIRSKKTGEVKQITMEEFHELAKKKSDGCNLQDLQPSNDQIQHRDACKEISQS